MRATLLNIIAPVLLTIVAVHELRYNHSSAGIWLLELAVIWPLAWRRQAPLIVFGVCMAFAVALWLTDTSTLAAGALLVALYSVAVHRDRRATIVAAAVLEVGVVLAAARFAPKHSVDDALLFLTGLVAAALFLGTTLRANRRYLAAAQDRARQLEERQAQEAQLAAAAERTRIAREMHDIVAHGLSVVVTLAEGAAAMAETDPPAAREAMEQVAAAGRQSMSEMRKVLEVLRTDHDGRTPTPGLAMLGELVEDVRRTGLTVEVDTSGDPAWVDPAAQATLYRIVQEALTNVLKHASRASVVRIALDYSAQAARFAIEDDGQATGLVTSGNGLTGMRERIAMFGGTLDAGPTATGWHVRGELELS